MTLPELVSRLKGEFRCEHKSVEAEINNEYGRLPGRYIARTSDTGRRLTAVLPAMSSEDPVSWIIVERICDALEVPREAFADVDGYESPLAGETGEGSA